MAWVQVLSHHSLLFLSPFNQCFQSSGPSALLLQREERSKGDTRSAVGSSHSRDRKGAKDEGSAPEELGYGTGLSTQAEVSPSRAVGRGGTSQGFLQTVSDFHSGLHFPGSRELPLDTVVVWMKSIPDRLMYLTSPVGGAP